jgi:amidase
MNDELWRLDAVATARLIRNGRVSAAQVVRSVLDRLDAVNPALNAVVKVLAEDALAAAAAADEAQARGDVLGPLHGVPVTIKVNTDQKGHATTNGVVAFRDNVATEDAPVVANLRRAGAILIGRTNTPAFSMRIFTENDLHGRTLNPLDREITPGGSSGGAGSAVAAGIGPIAHGNDIGGSVRIPAYCCGVLGLRAGLGRIPSFNMTATAAAPIGSQLMSVQGPLARTVRDLRLALSVMAQGDPRDTRWADVPLVGPAAPRRAALVPEVPGGFTHPAQAEAVRTAGRYLAAAGYAVEEIAPPDIEQVIEVWHRIGSTDVFGTLRPMIERLGGEAARSSVGHWMTLVPASDMAGVLGALAARDLLLRRWQGFFMDWPVVVLPTLADLPPPFGQDLTLDGQVKVLASLRACLIAPALGLPGLAIPVGRTGTLRPGVQIMAGRFREDLCLDAAEVIEAAEPEIVPVDPRW